MVRRTRKRPPTNIEVFLEAILRDMGLNFFKEYKIGNYPVDFYIKKYNLSIQVDGCFHHLCNKCYKDKEAYSRQVFQKRRDRACVLYHKYSKINILRLKECSLSDPESTKLLLLEVFDRISKGELIHEYR